MSSDLEHWHIDATVHKDRVEETHYISDPARNIRRKPQIITWQVEKSLGRGGCGEVRLERNTEDGKARAVKRITTLNANLSVNECEKELKALLEFSKPKSREAAVFVEFFGWFKDGPDIFLAMEYFQLGDLERNLLAYGGKIPEFEARDIGEQILSGLEIMHAHSFAHRDLKPQNVLVVNGSPEWWVKLGDFGLSKRLTDTTAYHKRSGTPSYMAPEVLDLLDAKDSGLDYTNAVDIWATGCIVYRMIAGHVPFPQIKSLFKYCENPSLFPYYDSFGSTIQNECSSFIRQLLGSDPNSRPSASEALKHAWIISGSETVQSSLESSTPSQKTDILLDLSELSVSRINFNTMTHAGLDSQSQPSGKIATWSTASVPPVVKQATVIRRPVPSSASDTMSSQMQNIASRPLEDSLSQASGTMSNQIQKNEQRPLPSTPKSKSITTLKALQDYTGRERGELSFRRNDLIIFANKINEDWWYGTIGDKKGCLPSRHVQAMPSNPVKTRFDPELQLAPGTSVPTHVKAIYDYSARESGDLEFRKGDILFVLEAKNQDWWTGALNDKEGLFPTNYMESLAPTTRELQEEKVTHVMALSDSEPGPPGFLVYRKGDIIQLFAPYHKRWWTGFRILSHGQPSPD